MTQGIFRKLFPKSKISNKIWNSENSGNGTEKFPETFSNILKKPLSHDPFLGKNIFWSVSTCTHEIDLDIVSAESSASWPRFLEIVSGICLYELNILPYSTIEATI